MEADWSVELAADDPIIAIPWTAPEIAGCRFIDLRQGCHLIDEIKEASGSPIVRAALLRLNSQQSQFWTTKCDAWTSPPGQGIEPLDPYDMGAEPGQTAFGAGSYIDMLPRDAVIRGCFERLEKWLRVVVERLRSMPQQAARVELVLRPAVVEGLPGFGLTWFAEGCGASEQHAAQRWGEAMEMALTVILEARL